MGQSVSRRRSGSNDESQEVIMPGASLRPGPSNSCPASTSRAPPKQPPNGASSAGDPPCRGSEQTTDRRRRISRSSAIEAGQAVPQPRIRQRASSMRAAAQRRLSGMIPKRTSNIPNPSQKVPDRNPNTEFATSSTTEPLTIIPPASPIPPGDTKAELPAVDTRERGDYGLIRNNEISGDPTVDHTPEHSIPSSSSPVGSSSSGFQVPS